MPDNTKTTCDEILAVAMNELSVLRQKALSLPNRAFAEAAIEAIDYYDETLPTWEHPHQMIEWCCRGLPPDKPIDAVDPGRRVLLAQQDNQLAVTEPELKNRHSIWSNKVCAMYFGAYPRHRPHGFAGESRAERPAITAERRSVAGGMRPPCKGSSDLPKRCRTRDS